MPIQKLNRVVRQYNCDPQIVTKELFMELVEKLLTENALKPVLQVALNLQFEETHLTGDLNEVKALLVQVEKDDAPHSFNLNITTNSNPRVTFVVSVAFGQRLITYNTQNLDKKQAKPLLKIITDSIPEIKIENTSDEKVESPTLVDTKHKLEYLPGAFQPIAMPETSDRDVFVIMSFDKKHRDAFNLAIEPTLNSLGFKAVRVDQIQHNTTVTPEIMRQIERSVFIVADLTGERPNVYYEVGYAHRADKEVILLARKETAVHFDVSSINRIEYDDYTELTDALRKRVLGIVDRLGIKVGNSG